MGMLINNIELPRYKLIFDKCYISIGVCAQAYSNL